MISDNRYPFPTKADVRRRLENEAAFVLECLALMQARHELRLSGAKADGPCGWMSSQRAKGIALAIKAAAGNLTAHETVEAARLLAGYARQITAVLRQRALAADPALADVARVFGVLPGPRASGPRRTDGERTPEPSSSATAGGKAEQAEPTGREEVAEAAEATPSAGGPPAKDPCDVCQGILDHLTNGRGGRAAEIAASLGVETADVSKHLRDLLDQGQVSKVGFGRGTSYSAR